MNKSMTSSSASITGLTASHLQVPSSTTPPPYNPEFIRRVSVDDPSLQSGTLGMASSSSFGTAVSPASSDPHRSSTMQIAMFKARRGMRTLGKKVKEFDEDHQVVEKSKAAAVTALRATKNGTVKGYQHVRKQISNRMGQPSTDQTPSSNKE
uniref:Uncharacterized protein n=1 Tax=Grammatophora oceanica TaxID=210454 RepID=A0A7S1UQV6_9STRA